MRSEGYLQVAGQATCNNEWIKNTGQVSVGRLTNSFKNLTLLFCLYKFRD
jgi:hypothetical protein